MTPAPSSSPPVAPAPGSYFRELESLRGIAIVLVLLFHAHVAPAWLGFEPLAIANPFIQAGHTGVTLFFVLSAFLLVLPFLREAIGEKPVDRRRFMVRRGLRILPLYLLCVVLAVVFAEGALSREHLVKGLRAVLFLPGLGPTLMPFSIPWWSLGTEVQFYLLLPLVTLLTPAQGGRRILALLGLAYGIAFVLACLPEIQAQFGLDRHQWRLVWATLFGRGPVFLAGVLAAWLFLTRGARYRARRADGDAAPHLAFDAALLGILGLLGLLLQFTVSRGHFLVEGRYPFWHIAEGLLWSAVLWLLMTGRPFLRPLFVNPLLHRLGVVSYSLYLWHCPVLTFGIRAIDDFMPGAFAPDASGRGLLLLGLLALTWGISELSYRYVEAPFLRRKAHLH